jgi:hypothetical protein
MLLSYKGIPTWHYFNLFSQMKSLSMPHALNLSSPSLCKPVLDVLFPLQYLRIQIHGNSGNHFCLRASRPYGQYLAGFNLVLPVWKFN